MNSSYLHSNDYHHIISICEKIITLNDIIIDPYEVLADIYSEMRDFNRMYVVKQIAARILKTDTACWLECARLANSPEIGEIIEAKKFYNRAIKLCGNLADRKILIKLKLEKFEIYKKLHDFQCINR